MNTERYYYDSGNRLTRVWETDASNNQHEFHWTYDSNDQVTELVETVNGHTFTYANSYNGDKQLTQSSYGAVQKGFTYDGLGRLSQSAVSCINSPVLTTGYTYRDLDATRTTTQVSALQNSFGNQSESLTYTYDARGNISSVSDGTHTTLYEYDTLNELVWEKNAEAEKAWHYSYDLGGNILSKEEYSYQNGVVGSTPLSTITYTYGDANWPDLLTVYDGSPITYDGMGNPTSYRGWSFTWQGGRRLKSANNGTTNLSFQYNESGLRTMKTVGTASHCYIYRGSRLAVEITGSYELYFHHDAGGSIVGFTYVFGNTQAEYFYRKNLQGDVIGIVDANGASVAEYHYDAWGQILSATGTMVDMNPIRYRGYYYDAETKLYYLHSRYYDPVVGRFLNADAYASTGQGILGRNMFAYCNNEPVNKTDFTGNDPGDLFDTMDEAARDFAFYINETSINEDCEYGSFIYSVSVWETKTITIYNPNLFGNSLLSPLWDYLFAKGISRTITRRVKVTKYSYVSPKKGSAHSVNIPINLFGAKNKVAEIHTHGAYSVGYSNDSFSKKDLNNWINYLVTPLGTVRRYTPSTGEDIIIFDDVPFDPNHPER